MDVTVGGQAFSRIVCLSVHLRVSEFVCCVGQALYNSQGS
jgi:hypothetical protein